MVDFLVGEFQAFDEDLGRLKNDIPADMMEEEEDSYDLFDFFDFGLSNDENENEEDENS